MALGQTFYNLSKCLHGSILIPAFSPVMRCHEVFVLPGYRILQNLRMITCKHTLRSWFLAGYPIQSRKKTHQTIRNLYHFSGPFFSMLTTDPNHVYTLRATMNPCSLTNKTFIFFAASFSFASSCLQKETKNPGFRNPGLATSFCGYKLSKMLDNSNFRFMVDISIYI